MPVACLQVPLATHGLLVAFLQAPLAAQDSCDMLASGSIWAIKLRAASFGGGKARISVGGGSSGQLLVSAMLVLLNLEAGDCDSGTSGGDCIAASGETRTQVVAFLILQSGLPKLSKAKER